MMLKSLKFNLVNTAEAHETIQEGKLLTAHVYTRATADIMPENKGVTSHTGREPPLCVLCCVSSHLSDLVAPLKALQCIQSLAEACFAAVLHDASPPAASAFSEAAQPVCSCLEGLRSSVHFLTRI